MIKPGQASLGVPITLSHPGDIISLDLYTDNNVVFFTSKTTKKTAFIFDPIDPLESYATIKASLLLDAGNYEV